MTELPAGWDLVHLGDVAETRLGKMLDKATWDNRRSMPYLRNANVQWGRIDTADVLTMEVSEDEVARFSLLTGDLLVCEGGEIGRSAIWSGGDREMAFQKALHRIRSSPRLDVRYLHYLTQHFAQNGTLVRFSTGSTIKHLPQEKLRQLPVPLPPMAEQRRIVELLDEHFSRLDAAEDLLVAARRRRAALVRSILEANIPGEIPPGWRSSTVAEAGRTQLGRARHPDWHHGPEMRPYLRVANVFEDRIDTSDVMSMDFSGLFDKYRLHDGDVLLNEGQSPHLLGRPAIYRGTPTDVAFTNSLIRFQANPGVLPEWALLVFRRHMHSGRFRRESRITTNIAHLSMARLRTVEFPVPPLAEQADLVARAREALDGVSRLDDQVDNAARRSRGLRRGLLEAAFTGRLTGRSLDTEIAEELADSHGAMA